MFKRLAVPAVLTTIALAGCGGSSKPASSSAGHNRPATAAYTQEQIAQKLNLRPSPSDPAGLELNGQDQCVASVIMTTPDQIKTYADAGDPVATNPSGTVGIKVGTFQGVDAQQCFDQFQTALKKLP